jgi:hypothetical protein
LSSKQLKNGFKAIRQSREESPHGLAAKQNRLPAARCGWQSAPAAPTWLVAPITTAIFAPVDDDAVLLIDGRSGVAEDSGFIKAVNDAIGIPECIDHKAPRAFPVFAILKPSVHVPALPTPGPPCGSGLSFVCALEEFKLKHDPVP